MPLVTNLRVTCVPMASVLAFCIASPIMNPEMFILTAAGLGLEFAVTKTIAGIGMGMLAGFAVLAIASAGLLTDALRPIAKPSRFARGPESPPPPVWWFWQFRLSALAGRILLCRWQLYH